MCGKVGKALGSVFGFGSSQQTTTQDPIATSQDVSDTAGDTADTEAAKKTKRKKGFASTQLRDWRSGMDTALGSNGGNKNTLG